jgi:kynurenine formamidase
MNGAGGILDYVGMFIHGVAQTHVDALCHIGAHQHGGRVYWNGKPFARGQMPKQHTGTVDFWQHGIVGRGVLYDIPRLRGTPWCEEGQPVHGWELADAAAAQGVEPASGDVVIIRCGRDAFAAAHPEVAAGAHAATGVHASCVEFLAETEASMLVWDWLDAPTEQQGLPNPFPGEFALHVHSIVLPYMGMPIVDNADLEALSAACADLDRYQFQLVVAPLVIHRGTGSPVNPIAIF